MLQLAAFVFVVVVATARPLNHDVHGAAERAEWAHVSHAAADAEVKMVFAIKHAPNAMEIIDATCQSVSDPQHKQYGQHLNMSELKTLLAPEANHRVVYQWLMEHGVTSIDNVETGDFIVARTTAAVAGVLVGAPFSVYARTLTTATRTREQKILRVRSVPSLPAKIAGAVDVVLGVSDFPLRLRRHQPSRAMRGERPVPVAVRAANTVVAPQVAEILLDAVTATIIFAQGCPDGTQSTTPVPCSASGAPISKYTVQVTAMNGGGFTANIPVPSANLTISTTGPLAGLYMLTLGGIEVYTRYWFTISSTGADGSTSSPSALGYQNVSAADQWMLASPYITLGALRTYYGTPSHSVPDAAGSSQSVAEFGGQFLSFDDMSNWAHRYDPSIVASKIKVVGPNNASQPGDEAMLDIEWILGVAPTVTAWFWSVSMNDPNDAFILDWAMQMNNNSNAPLVTSISYGDSETDITANFGADYISRSNLEMAKLCARGLTITVSSGDAGSTNNGHGGTSCTVAPDFPTSSPYVTSVSATAMSGLAPSRDDGAPGEVAVSIPTGLFWTTGGGFSNFSSQPSWQKAAVAAYLAAAGASGVPPSGLFNAQGRGYPDISAIGHNLLTVDAGLLLPADGTSASSPIFAGMVALLNNVRLAAGKPPVGFLNPLMYSIQASYPEVFYDVTVGENSCGAFSCCDRSLGFSTTTGWDAVTGLGTVQDFALLQKIVLAAAAHL